MPGRLFFFADAAGNVKGLLPAMTTDRHRSFSLFAVRRHPAYFVSVEPLVESNSDDPGVGVADRNHMFVGPQFSQASFYLIAPGQGRQEAGITTAALFIGKELGMGLTAESHPYIPAVGALLRLIDPGNVLVLFKKKRFLVDITHEKI